MTKPHDKSFFSSASSKWRDLEPDLIAAGMLETDLNVVREKISAVIVIMDDTDDEKTTNVSSSTDLIVSKHVHASETTSDTKNIPCDPEVVTQERPSPVLDKTVVKHVKASKKLKRKPEKTVDFVAIKKSLELHLNSTSSAHGVSLGDISIKQPTSVSNETDYARVYMQVLEQEGYDNMQFLSFHQIIIIFRALYEKFFELYRLYENTLDKDQKHNLNIAAAKSVAIADHPSHDEEAWNSLSVDEQQKTVKKVKNMYVLFFQSTFV